MSDNPNSIRPMIARIAQKTSFDQLVLGFAWCVTIAAMATGVVPLSLVALFLIVVFIILVAGLAVGQYRIGFALKSPIFRLVVVFTAYLGLSSFWSVNAWDVFPIAGLVLALSVTIFVPQLITGMTDLQLHRSARGVLIGFLIALGYVLTEHFTGFFLLHSVNRFLPFLSQSPMSVSDLNRNVTLLVLFLWPTLLIMQKWGFETLNRALIGLIVAALVIILFHTQSGTAELAFLTALVTFISAYFAPRYMWNIVRVSWAVAIILIVPLTMMLGKSGLHSSDRLGLSTRHRILIWNYTANKIPKNPLLGVGVRSGRYSNDNPEKIVVRSRYSELKYSPKAWHPHNMYLQIWYELGVVGAAFVLVIGLMLLNHIRRLQSELQPYALATFSAFAAITGVGWGMWQSWLLAAYGWAIILSIIAFEFARRRKMGGAENHNGVRD